MKSDNARKDAIKELEQMRAMAREALEPCAASARRMSSEFAADWKVADPVVSPLRDGIRELEQMRAMWRKQMEPSGATARRMNSEFAAARKVADPFVSPLKEAFESARRAAEVFCGPENALRDDLARNAIVSEEALRKTLKSVVRHNALSIVPDESVFHEIPELELNPVHETNERLERLLKFQADQARSLDEIRATSLDQAAREEERDGAQRRRGRWQWVQWGVQVALSLAVIGLIVYVNFVAP